MSLIFKNKIDEILYKIKSNDLNSAKKLSLKLIKKNKKDFQLKHQSAHEHFKIGLKTNLSLP